MNQASQERLSDEMVWEAVSGAEHARYLEYLATNQRSVLALLRDQPEPADIARNWDVPTEIEIRSR